MSDITIYYHDNGNVHYKEWTHEINYYHHRLDGPCYVEYSRSGLPSITTWQVHGERHREDGPAMVDHSQNIYRWFLCNEEYIESAYEDAIEFGKSIVTRDQAIMNYKHPCKYIRRICQEILNGV